jgi:rod shape-determining protein MreC
MTDKNKNQEIRILIILLILSLSLIGLDKLGWLKILKRPVETISNPIRQRAYNFKLKFNRAVKPEEIDSYVLQEKIEFLQIENANLKNQTQELVEENKDLRRLVQAPLPQSYQFIPAKVISIKNGTMTINQGEDIGIKKDQIAVYENVLIGIIIETTPKTSKIRLPINKETNIKAKVLENNGEGTVKADINDNLILDEILQEVELQKDQIIITSGEKEIFPEGLLIGKIESVEKDETAVYQSARLMPLVEYINLINVFIIKS